MLPLIKLLLGSTFHSHRWYFKSQLFKAKLVFKFNGKNDLVSRAAMSGLMLFYHTSGKMRKNALKTIGA